MAKSSANKAAQRIPRTGSVVGIEIAGRELRLIMLRREDDGRVVAVPSCQLKATLPTAGGSNGENLQLLLTTLSEPLRTWQPDQIAVLRADQNSGVDRIKLEAVLELASFAEKRTPHMYAVATINAWVKRGGKAPPFADVPRYFERAMHCAGCYLDGC